MSGTYESTLKSIRARRMPGRLNAILQLLIECGVDMETGEVYFTLYPQGRPKKF